jgi:hypothetical protein
VVGQDSVDSGVAPSYRRGGGALWNAWGGGKSPWSGNKEDIMG